MPDAPSGPRGTTRLIYNPTQADRDPVGDGWITDYSAAGHSGWRIQSNALMPDPGGAFSEAQAYRGGVYGGSQELWGQWLAKGANLEYLDFTICLSSPNSSYNLYLVEVTPLTAGTDTWDLYRVKAGVGSLVASASFEVTAGAGFMGACTCEIIEGNAVIGGWYWNGAPPWQKIVTFTDSGVSKILTGGMIGLGAVKDGDWQVGKLYGGTIIPQPAPLDHAAGGRRGDRVPWRP